LVLASGVPAMICLLTGVLLPWGGFGAFAGIVGSITAIVSGAVMPPVVAFNSPPPVARYFRSEAVRFCFQAWFVNALVVFGFCGIVLHAAGLLR
jgi:hypothetical protein